MTGASFEPDSPSHVVDRRSFLERIVLASVALAVRHDRDRPSVGPPRRFARTLVFVDLAGGLDGLSVVVNPGLRSYYARRPTIAVPPPGAWGGALPLNRAASVGLTPHWAPLYELFARGEMRVHQAVGHATSGLTHFASRELVMSGLRGDGDPVACGGIGCLVDGARRLGISAVGFGSEWARDLVCTSGRTTLVPGEVSLDASLAEVARSLQSDPCPMIACVRASGFDTHADQAATLATRLPPVATAIATFVETVRAAGRWDDVSMILFSEFGRAVSENPDGGTDHGQGGVFLELGGAVRGGMMGAPLTEADLAGPDVPARTDLVRLLRRTVLRHLAIGQDASHAGR